MPDLPDSLTGRTAFLLRMALARAEEMGEAALADTGIDGREYGLLELMADGAPRTQIALGRDLRIDRTTCAALLSGLDDRGLVQRTADPSNRRANLVTLTPEGEHRRAVASRTLADCDERFQARLSSRERAALRRLLRTLVGGAD